MKRLNRRNNKGIAPWLKWLLIIMVVGVVLLVATCGIGGYFLMKQFGNIADPAAAKQMASGIATIRELPANQYKYAFGMDMFGLCKIVGIQDEQSGIQFTLITMPNKEKGLTADQLVSQMAQQGVPTGGASSGSSSTTKIDVKSQGKTQVGGMEMPYITGIAEGKNGEKKPAFIGCVLPSSEMAVLVCAFSDTGTDIDMAKVKNFLSYIENFSPSASAAK